VDAQKNSAKSHRTGKINAVTQTPAAANDRRYRLARMTGRNPHENHRAATPLELLFDLTFVVSFGIAGSQFAHLVAIGHVWEGTLGFTIAMAAVCWAWINFTWFASAFDTDDWFYRVTTMVQMVGVVVVALGLPALFHSLEEGDHVDNRVVVAGYIVMRVAYITQWIRAAKQDPTYRATAVSYVLFVGLAQLGWVLVAILDLPTTAAVIISVALFAFEGAGPIISERKAATPWHPHHIAERYGLLTIIALGEVLLGTVTTVSALVEHQNWSVDAILVVVAGVGITFGIWWMYFMMPSGVLLERHSERSFGWGYGHVAIFAAIAAVGAGLHVIAYVIEGEATIGVLGAILAVAVPVAVFTTAYFIIYTRLMREYDPFHIGLFVGTMGALAVAVVLAATGASIGLCLIIATLAPAVSVVGYETVGHRHQAEALKRALA